MLLNDRDRRAALIRHALFGEDTWRFSAMLGTFTSLYKFLINALPILIPALNPSEGPKLSLELPLPVTAPTEKGANADETTTQEQRAHLTARAQLVLIRKSVRRWHAALAGAVAGGLAIMCEKRNRRGVISQQMFVRYVPSTGTPGRFLCERLEVSKGHIMLLQQQEISGFLMATCLSFLLRECTTGLLGRQIFICTSCSCGQIMYAWLLRRDTLPRSYTGW